MTIVEKCIPYFFSCVSKQLHKIQVDAGRYCITLFVINSDLVLCTEITLAHKLRERKYCERKAQNFFIVIQYTVHETKKDDKSKTKLREIPLFQFATKSFQWINLFDDTRSRLETYRSPFRQGTVRRQVKSPASYTFQNVGHTDHEGSEFTLMSLGRDGESEKEVYLLNPFWFCIK